MPTPFVNERMTLTNPDGSTIEVIGTGNQFYAHFETIEGYTVVKDPQTGFYAYAKASADNSQLVPVENGIVGKADPESLQLEKHIRVPGEADQNSTGSSEGFQNIEPRWKQRREDKKKP